MPEDTQDNTPTAQEEFEKLRQEVQDVAGVESSAIIALTRIPERIQAAVAEAIAGGATKEQIQEVVDEQVNLMKTNREALAAAILANG